ncbi:DUF1841 family protein [Alkalilimnicola sp. S0819]|uniref:DUF1841 family protein n=1 Tax=Alkalilimnicola sp. S0819 TaxID=2613922 RepID=UPI001261F4F6|nr:DUF1841 family protein [Alkalilimnicola sp. S0819]KAB7623194.1 DUF1841 family protein [Alkalilimnicola sp. S0819]MPQ17040.1 DUF1841 family protein [Alkalilimnicola sp. S0819]
MFYSQDRDQIRRVYLESWRKAREGLPMEAIEQLVADVVMEHPEYHALLEHEERSLGREFLPELGEANPFMHMGMHIAIREQVASNRPQGIRALHRRLCRAYGGVMEAEHAMMECLGEVLWQSQQMAMPPDEAAYMRALKGLETR